MVLVRGVVFLITGGAPVSGETGLPGEFVAFGSDRFLGIHYLVWVPAVLLAVLSWVMHATPYGRRVYATGGGREAAYLSGIPVRRVIASTYVWCGALAGVAGVMLAARLQSGQPTAGEFYELTAIAAVVLGGAALHGGEGTLYKSVIGVFIMIVLGNALNLLNVDSYWQRVAVGAVIIAAAAAERLRSHQDVSWSFETQLDPTVDQRRARPLVTATERSFACSSSASPRSPRRSSFRHRSR